MIGNRKYVLLSLVDGSARKWFRSSTENKPYSFREMLLLDDLRKCTLSSFLITWIHCY